MNSTTTTIAITIYNRTDRSRFWTIQKAREFGDDPILEVAYRYADDVPFGETADDSLNRAWRANNRVDGSAVEMLPDDKRSLCVGDVIRFGEGFASRCWQVMEVGFEPVGTLEVADMVES